MRSVMKDFWSSPFLPWYRVFAITLSFVLTQSSAEAQSWRTPTPRDTVYVPANTIVPVQSNRLHQSSAVFTDFYISGTFGAFTGQKSSGFDGAYTYNVPNWSAPYPLPNPPSFGTTS